MPVVVRKHAFWTDDGVTKLAEILNFFVLMLVTEHLTCAGLGYGSLGLKRRGIGLSWRTKPIQLLPLDLRSLIDAIYILHQALELFILLLLLHNRS